MTTEHDTETYHSSDHDGDLGPHVVEEHIMALAPVYPDINQHYAMVVQHLGIEIANRAVEAAQLQAKTALALSAYGALRIDTWVRQVAHEPSMNGEEPVRIPGPIVIPPSEHEALSRFLAAVEGLR